MLEATADREKNRIDVVVQAPASADPKRTEAERAATLDTLSFHVDDRLLDPAREIVVAVDGRERWRGVAVPSLATLLRTAEEREDPEYAFALEVPPPAR